MEERLKKPLSHLQRLCSQREYCRKDILRKAVLLCDGDSADAESLVKSLEDEGYVDNSRYATAFAREKSSITGWGPEKIAYQLRLKGIDKNLISSALAETDSDKAVARLRKLLLVKWKSLKNDPEAKLKLIRFALSRGYNYTSVRPLIEEIAKEEEEEEKSVA